MAFTDFNNDIYLDVCRNIGVELKMQYDALPELTDHFCIFGLGHAVIAIKKTVIRHSEYGTSGYYDFIKNYV
jgi:hypothetical protein